MNLGAIARKFRAIVKRLFSCDCTISNNDLNAWLDPDRAESPSGGSMGRRYCRK